MPEPSNSNPVTRRSFLETGAAGLGTVASAAVPQRRPPNLLYIICDQLNIDALSAYGNPYVHTPNLDRLARRGVSFMESNSTNPVCSPARSTLMTGRMPVETAVVANFVDIDANVPNIGQWFGEHGYETVYCGKWHLGEYYPSKSIPGFITLPAGVGEGCAVDPFVARACESYLRNRSHSTPYLFVAAFLQPHDICVWPHLDMDLVPKDMPFPELSGRLPPLPPNNKVRPREPKRLREWTAKISAPAHGPFSDEQWRFYIYCYYRQVEMLDAQVGRVLDALDASGEAENTIVLFTSDHGEGAGRHGLVEKWYPYEHSIKVPLIVSCPARMEQNLCDRHLVSGLDTVATLCDYAGIPPPPHARGSSLRPLAEGRRVAWRDFVAAELMVIGRLIRTRRYKYVQFKDDPVEQLFDMENDPWEMKNIFDDPSYAGVMADHRKLLAEWESRLIPAPPAKPRTNFPMPG